ncbi:hypothetical protein [Streptomyces sp. NPDC086010]|uniref:hypothetical protein n=1 Tax=Streptomyces sp. NPDC086010 TaxID=3365745 RepID=UPI0037D0BB69
MISVAHTANSIETAAGNLQEELLRLEVQQHSLERELAAVVAHLGSVQQALAAMQELMGTALPAVPDALTGGSPSRPSAELAGTGKTADAGPAGTRAETAPASTPQTRATRPSTGVEDGTYGRLTEQIMEFFGGTGGAEVRARDVAAALGRDTDASSINAVRSTLDRLVGTSRIKRAGRGLYRAKPS